MVQQPLVGQGLLIIEASRYATFGRIPLDELWLVQNLEIHAHSYLKEINPLKPELNPICYLLALLGAHIFSTLAG